MLKRSAFAALVLAGFASAAFAQTQSPQTNSEFVSSALNPGGPRYDNLNNQARLWRQSMINDPRADVSPAEFHRARQAVALIKVNRCEEAYNQALAAQDNRLALNIAVACKARLRQ